MSHSPNQLMNILLVEDDDGDALAIQRAFRNARFANPIKRATDGLQALGMLQGVEGAAPVVPPCLLLVDINMPRMNGIQLLKSIREQKGLQSLVVFILSTSNSDLDKQAAYDLNVAGYITKAAAANNFQGLVSLLDWYWRLVELPA